MRQIGFSTGALARGNFRGALSALRRYNVTLVELSALRTEELDPLVAALPSLDLHNFSFISVHAPSRFSPDEEPSVIERLLEVANRGYPVIVHPDVIAHSERWGILGNRLVIENMDKRKPVGRTVAELRKVFEALPAAGFCFDIGHARQVDPSMTEASLMLKAFGHRLVEVHMSEVNTASRHDPISLNAVMAFSPVAAAIPENVPIILEPLIDNGQSDIAAELRRALDVFTAAALPKRHVAA
jgi:sugar phosphate isomerase/epimerase